MNRIRMTLTLLLLLCGCKDEIARDLQDHQLRKIVGVLSDAGLHPDMTKQPDDQWSISVDHSETLRAMSLIEQFRLVDPKSPEQQESSIFMSDQEQRLQYEQDVGKRVETALRSLDGILDAKVILNLPRAEPMQIRKQEQKGSGSVLVIGTVDLLVTAEEIQKLVAGASGLAASDIHVLIKSGKVPSPSNPLAQQDTAHYSVVHRMGFGIFGLLSLGVGAFMLKKFGRGKHEFTI